MRINSVNSFTYNDTQVRQTKPNFQRNWSEHASWGARYIKERGKASFKLFTFPDVKKVFVEVAKKASSDFGGIKDRIANIVFAQGAALTLSTVIPENEDSKIYEMNSQGNGVFEAKDIEAEEGLQYRYIIVKDDNDIRMVKDPYSMQQPHINGWSEIYNPDNYEWKNTAWLEGKDERRIIRKPNEKLRGLDNLFIEEVNIPTLSDKGSFKDAYAHIDRIAEKGIATAIEIMPVENAFSLQWGYDGVDKFAVNPKMGTQVEFKELIDYAHGKGLNVIIDIVPNHVGPDGNYLSQTGPYRGRAGRFGDVPNYEKQNNRYVRDWMVNSALWWLTEYKADGLRLDMTKDCESDWFLRQLATEVNEHVPNAFLIAEDGRENWSNVTAYNRFTPAHKEELEIIDANVNSITNQIYAIYPQNLGYDSEWDFPLMHSLYDSIIQPDKINLDKLDYNIRNSNHRVKFVMSHDEIGNLDGTRLLPKVIASDMYLFGRVNGATDAEKGQAAAHLSQKLAELYVTRDIRKMSTSEITDFARAHGLASNQTVTADEIETVFNIGRAKHKMQLATVFSIPGPKMYFQGDDELDLSRFKFFRELSSDAYDRVHKPGFVMNMLKRKGYDELESIARPESVIGKVPVKDSPYRAEMERFTKDLADVVKSSKALLKGDVTGTFKDIHHNVHTHLLKSGSEEVLVIKNFGGKFHNGSYGFEWFPEGQWKEIFNSDSTIYGGSGYTNENRGNSISWTNQNLNLAPNSVIILKKV